MKPIRTLLRMVVAVAVAFPLLANGAAVPGQPAPDFSVSDAAGRTHTLADYKGSWLVLEWFNKECPYVKKHYGSKNMQTLQKTYTGKGVKWLTVISSAPGKQGHFTPQQAVEEAAAHELAASAPYLLDTDGTMGKAYDARTTPHMFVIDPQGVVVYAGAIDDNDSANPAVIASSKNLVAAALDDALAGRPVATPASRPYGCSVKY
jgi:peroxiredoxin